MMGERMNMIERIARAMSSDPDSTETSRAHPSGQWLDDGEPDWKGYVDQAHAVLEAMREPTETMIEAGASVGGGFEQTNSELREQAGEYWQAMIDAALAE